MSTTTEQSVSPHRLREARRMYGAGSEEYKNAVEEAKKTKESMVAAKDVV